MIYVAINAMEQIFGGSKTRIEMSRSVGCTLCITFSLVRPFFLGNRVGAENIEGIALMACNDPDLMDAD